MDVIIYPERNKYLQLGRSASLVGTIYLMRKYDIILRRLENGIQNTNATA